MRYAHIVAVALSIVLPAVTAQTNATTAALAGAGAGAALGAGAGQGSTSPSSLTGGGQGGGGSSSAIEIQMMAFSGLARIATDIAEIVYQSRAQCKPLSDKDGFQEHLDNVLRSVHKHADQFNQDRRESTTGTEIDKDLIAVSQDLQSLEVTTKPIPGCSILIEDNTSANQIGLYQALEGYYQNLRELHRRIQDFFPWQVALSPIAFSKINDGTPQDALLSLRNVGTGSEDIPADSGIIASSSFATDSGTIIPNVMTVAPTASTNACGTTLDAGEICVLTLRITPNSVEGGTLTATLRIPTGNSGFYQMITITKKIAGQAGPAQNKEALAKKLERESKKLQLKPDEQRLYDAWLKTLDARAYIGLDQTTTGTGAPTAGPTSSTTPVELTYLSGIMTALSAVKSGITYSPSSFQPTIQAFTTLIESELRLRGIRPYTSTSSLDVSNARNDLTKEFAEMLGWGNDISNWTAVCKPPPQTTAPVNSAKDVIQTNTACDASNTTIDIAVAQQMIAGYTTLISAANDGSGNAAIVAILHGKVLSDKMKDGIPSLQVTVAAAGGSTRTNNFFLLNLFYSPKPSYNAGVIATFELRDKDNNLEASGARNVLYDYVGYKTWKPESFAPSSVKVSDQPATPCTFCAAP